MVESVVVGHRHEVNSCFLERGSRTGISTQRYSLVGRGVVPGKRYFQVGSGEVCRADVVPHLCRGGDKGTRRGEVAHGEQGWAAVLTQAQSSRPRRSSRAVSVSSYIRRLRRRTRRVRSSASSSLLLSVSRSRFTGASSGTGG